MLLLNRRALFAKLLRLLGLAEPTLLATKQVADHYNPESCIWVEPTMLAKEMVLQVGIQLWLVAQPRGNPKTVDRPFLLRSLRRASAPTTAGALARPLYASVSPLTTVEAAVVAMRSSYLPVLPVIENGQLMGTIGFAQILALQPRVARELVPTVRPFAEEIEEATLSYVE